MSDTIKDNESEIQELDSMDFDEINSLINNLRFVEARELIEELGNVTLYDIRTLFYLVYCRIHNSSLDEFTDNLEVACAVLEDQKLNLMPKDNFQRHLENTLEWFCNTLESNVKYRIREREFTYLDFDPIEEKFIHLSELLSDYTDLNLASYSAKLRGLLGELSVKEEILEEAEEIEEENINEQIEVGSAPASGNCSSKWQDLQSRIDYFRRLMQAGRYLDAALFFKDIQDKISKFDPRKYFPEIFYPLYESMDSNFQKVLSVINYQQNSLQWHVAEQKYKIDATMLANDQRSIDPPEYTSLSGYLRNSSAPAPPQDSGGFGGGGEYGGGFGGGAPDGGGFGGGSAPDGGYPGMEGGSAPMDSGGFNGGGAPGGFNQGGGMPGMYDDD
ncbi:MAG: hypothetical protein GY750_05690 [Lentisphaerae bacterium]|nr:hypothetical protein [Lentisphaerota bacterium]